MRCSIARFSVSLHRAHARTARYASVASRRSRTRFPPMHARDRRSRCRWSRPTPLSRCISLAKALKYCDTLLSLPFITLQMRPPDCRHRRTDVQKPDRAHSGHRVGRHPDEVVVLERVLGRHPLLGLPGEQPEEQVLEPSAVHVDTGDDVLRATASSLRWQGKDERTHAELLDHLDEFS